jgi:hypothetical protein
MAARMSDLVSGPYHVERLDTPKGRRWRLAGPGLDDTRSYPWEEVGEKLTQMAALMNFAWQQCEARQRNTPPQAD